jgi:hypothetical protein
MADIVIRLGQCSVAIAIPEYLLQDGILGSLHQVSAATSVDKKIVISEGAGRSFVLRMGRLSPETGLTRGRLLIRLLDVLADQFAAAAQVPTLKAAAVGRGDGAILIAGPDACGKSSLAAFFLEKGFAFIADNQITILDETGSLAGYPAPLSFPAAGADHLVTLGDIATAPMARTAERILIGVKPSWMAQGASPFLPADDLSTSCARQRRAPRAAGHPVRSPCPEGAIDMGRQRSRQSESVADHDGAEHPGGRAQFFQL